MIPIDYDEYKKTMCFALYAIGKWSEDRAYLPPPHLMIENYILQMISEGYIVRLPNGKVYLTKKGITTGSIETHELVIAGKLDPDSLSKARKVSQSEK